MTIDLGKQIKLECVLIQPGEFMMGAGPTATEQANPYARGRHRVKIARAYHVGVYEITQRQYERIMGNAPSERSDGGKDCPVNNVNWSEAAEFCERLSTLTSMRVRLPTEAEWEYACRAGSTTAYSFGDDANQLSGHAWYGSDGELHPVGQKKPNAWGLYDMHGNAAEWCSDWYARYANSSQTNPAGPGSGEYRVVRGGSALHFADDCCSCSRHLKVPGLRDGTLGFRIVVETEASDPSR